MSKNLKRILKESQTPAGGTDRTYQEFMKFLSKDKSLVFANRPLPGQMLFFKYNPTNEKFLSIRNTYYDIFPLIFVCEVDKWGFEGINMHYLDPEKREFLFDAMLKQLPTLTSSKETHDRLLLDYNKVRNMRRLKFFKPCYKRYLLIGLEKRPIVVPSQYWKTVAMEELGFFMHKKKPSVYTATNKIIAKGK